MAPCRRHPVAEQRARRHLPDRGERPQREDQRRQQAENPGNRQRHGVEAEAQRHRQQPVEQRRDQRGEHPAEQHSGGDADERERHDLQEVCGEDQAGRCAEAFQRGDRVGLARDKPGNRIADPDPADEQRGDAGEAQEKPDPVEQAPQRGRCIGIGAQLPAGFRKGGARGAGPARGIARSIASGEETQPIIVVDESARPDQPRLVERRAGDDHPGTEEEPGERRVGLALDDRGEMQHRIADAEPVAELEAEAAGDRGRGDRARGTAVGRQRAGERLGRCEPDRAVQRVGVVDRLKLDEAAPLAVERTRHGAQLGGLRQGPARCQEPALRLARRAVGEAGADIAAEEGARIGPDPGLDRGAQGADPRDRADPEHQAGEKDAEAADPAAQLAARQAQGVAELGPRASEVLKKSPGFFRQILHDEQCVLRDGASRLLRMRISL